MVVRHASNLVSIIDNMRDRETVAKRAGSSVDHVWPALLSFAGGFLQKIM